MTAVLTANTGHTFTGLDNATINGQTAGISGNTGSSVTLTFAFPVTGTSNVAPSITTQPTNQSVQAGNNATFTAVATGTPAPTFQWQVNSGGGWTNVAGATNATLTLTSVTTVVPLKR